VVFYLTAGGSITLPKYKAIGITFTQPPAFNPGEIRNVTYMLTGNVLHVKVMDVPQGWSVKVTKTGSAGTFTITAPATFDANNDENGEAVILISDGAERTVMRTLLLTGASILQVDKNSIVAAAEGGNYSIAVTSTLPWTATVSAGAGSWCTLSPDAGSGNGVITVQITSLASGDRSATVTITAGTLAPKTVTVTQVVASQVVESGITGACTWTLTGTLPNYTLTISGNGAMGNHDAYHGDYAPWFYFRSDIRNLVIQDGVTTIGESAFYNCSSLTGALTIPNSVTTIGNYAFYGCTGLTGALTLPNSVTTIGKYAFYGCTGLTGALTIPNSVTTIDSSAFQGCSGLTGALTIPNSVTTIGSYAFSSCSGLTGALTIPNSVTTIGADAFANCYRLTSVTIPNSVTTIGERAFSGCTGLTSVTIGNSVTTISGLAFSGCTGLTEVTNYRTTPQSIGSSTFQYVILSNVTLRVPSSAVSAYRAADVWKNFRTITGI
jgi:hypothetical protein